MAKNGQKQAFKINLDVLRLRFHRKTKLISFQSTSSDILKDVKDSKETNSRPFHMNNI